MQKVTPEQVAAYEARKAEEAKGKGTPIPPPLEGVEKLAAMSAKDTIAYQTRGRGLKDVEFSLLNKLEAILQFETLAQEAGLNPEQRLTVLRVKEEYENQIEDIGRELMFGQPEVNFKRETHGLPSRACDDARRLKFNEPYLTSRSKALIQILLQLGALQKQPLLSSLA